MKRRLNLLNAVLSDKNWSWSSWNADLNTWHDDVRWFKIWERSDGNSHTILWAVNSKHGWKNMHLSTSQTLDHRHTQHSGTHQVLAFWEWPWSSFWIGRIIFLALHSGFCWKPSERMCGSSWDCLQTFPSWALHMTICVSNPSRSGHSGHPCMKKWAVSRAMIETTGDLSNNNAKTCVNGS